MMTERLIRAVSTDQQTQAHHDKDFEQEFYQASLPLRALASLLSLMSDTHSRIEFSDLNEIGYTIEKALKDMQAVFNRVEIERAKNGTQAA